MKEGRQRPQPQSPPRNSKDRHQQARPTRRPQDRQAQRLQEGQVRAHRQQEEEDHHQQNLQEDRLRRNWVSGRHQSPRGQVRPRPRDRHFVVQRVQEVPDPQNDRDRRGRGNQSLPEQHHRVSLDHFLRTRILLSKDFRRSFP